METQRAQRAAGMAFSVLHCKPFKFACGERILHDEFVEALRVGVADGQ